MKSHWMLYMFIFILMSNSYASFPVINNEAAVVSITTPSRFDTFGIIGWISLGCLALGGVFMSLLA